MKFSEMITTLERQVMFWKDPHRSRRSKNTPSCSRDTLGKIISLLVAIVFLFFNLSVQAGMVLWNTLGSEDEVQHSKIGAGFEIEQVKVCPEDPEPKVYFVEGVEGKALGTYGGGSYCGGGGRLRMSPDDFFPPDKTKGTVEVWIQKRIQAEIPYQTPFVHIFGYQYYARNEPPEMEGYNSIGVLWADGVTAGAPGLLFYIYDNNGNLHRALDSGWNDVPVGQWVHMAFAWDLNGIEGSSDRMRIYRNGAITAKNSDQFNNVYPDTHELKILAHHASNRFEESMVYIDEIKVWDRAETPPVPDLILWNKLGSEDEVQHSKIGAGFEIEQVKVCPEDPEPKVYFVEGVEGKALGTYGGGSYCGGGGRLRMSPDDFFPPDKTKGTVEVWIQKRIQAEIPYQTPFVHIFGYQYYARNEPPEMEGYNAIGVLWADGVTAGAPGLLFYIYDNNGNLHRALDSGWDDVPVGQWVHMAFAWDLNGIEGSSDRMRIYRNGAVTAKNTDQFNSVYPDTHRLKVLAHHASNRFKESMVYIDEMKVWSYAKSYVPPCDVVAYVVHDGGLNDSLLLSVSNPNLQFTPIGSVHKGYDLEALALHPQTHVLYASSGENPGGSNAGKAGYLYKVDGENVIELGSPGNFSGGLEGLSFNPLTNVLWGWAQGTGLVKFSTLEPNPQTDLVLSYTGEIQDLTWNPQGNTLYAVENRPEGDKNKVILWAYQPENGSVKKQCDKELEGWQEVEALQALPDGTLLFGLHNSSKLLTGTIDPNTCQVGTPREIQVPYDDIEGITLTACPLTL